MGDLTRVEPLKTLPRPFGAPLENKPTQNQPTRDHTIAASLPVDQTRSP